MSWSKKYTECKNCGTQRFPHKFYGYCIRCYYSAKKLEEIKLWELEQPQTLKGYPRDMIFYNSRNFEKIKKGQLKQYKERLDNIKYSEKMLEGQINGQDLEYKIKEVTNLSGVNGAKLFFGVANIFDSYFNAKQRKIIYEKLNCITENVRWKGINWNKIFFDK